MNSPAGFPGAAEMPMGAAPIAALPAPAGARPRRRRDHLATTAWALMANTGLTSLTGMAFWIVASGVYSPQQVGTSAALISAMMLLSVISQLDLAMGISRLLPQVMTHRWRAVLGAYGVTAAVGIPLTAVFVVVAPRLSTSFRFLGHFGFLSIALMAAVVLWNVFALQDAVLTSARWSPVVPLENGIFGVIKLGLMVLLVHHFAGQGIFLGWVLAMAVMLVPVNSLIFGRVLATPGGTTSGDASAPVSALPIANRASVARYLAGDYAAGLFNQGYTALLPLLVLAVLGREANAYFYIVFTIALAGRAVAQSMSTALVVEGSHREAGVASMARLSVIRYAKYALLPLAVVFVGAGLVLKPFGAAYVHHGTTLLRLFLAATVPHAVISLYLAVERVRARVGRVLAVEALIVVLVTIGALAGMHRFGLAGIGMAWLGAHTLVAVMVAPAFWKACRQRPAPAAAS
ncbi:MAG TPA: hypothetical protein VHT75_17210 [Acidimicrobiales bacterium]|nr:hypothetical protein [Acidimicrobiales bacterium]